MTKLDYKISYRSSILTGLEINKHLNKLDIPNVPGN
jgi:hypothetical protein